MLDLSGQYRKIQQEIEVAIHAVIDSAAFINGTAVTDFAADLSSYTGAGYVIPCANGTDALQISLMALDLKPGDEIILPAFTYVAAAEAVALLGLIPVFVDVDIKTCNIDIQKIQTAITSKTRAIIPVHLFGQSVDMQPLLQMAKTNNLYVVEDTAQSIGAVYTFSDGTKKQCGTMGHIGCLSFFPSKNLGCFGDGGAMLTNDAALAGKLKMIASHGQSVKYRHEMIGCNSRLDTLQAAVLQVKLRYLNEYIAARQKAAYYYTENLQNLNEYLQLPVETSYSTHVYHQYTIQVSNGKRDALKAFLQEKGIPTMIYYPLSMPEQPVFNDMNQPGKAPCNFPQSCLLAQSVLSLPMHTELEEEQLYYIVNQIKTFFS